MKKQKSAPDYSKVVTVKKVTLPSLAKKDTSNNLVNELEDEPESEDELVVCKVCKEWTTLKEPCC